MLKRISSFLLLILIISSSFTRLFYFAGYEMNKDYIAQNLCINKDKPWLHCNGKCFLMRKIAQAEKNQQNQEKQIQKDLYQQVMLVSVFKFQFFKNTLTDVFPFFKEKKVFLPQSSIFHPPPVLV